jgi:hypothetical protein
MQEVRLGGGEWRNLGTKKPYDLVFILGFSHLTLPIGMDLSHTYMKT